MQRLGFRVELFTFTPYRSGGNPLTDLYRNASHTRCEYLRCLEQMREFQPDALYIRYSFADSHFIHFLQHLRKKLGATLPICLEIATYPYDNELRSLRRPGLFYLYLADLVYRRQLRHHIDWVVTFTTLQEIFGLPTINISNGVDTRAIRPVNSNGQQVVRDGYHFIGVSNLGFWTGYERLIDGLAEYANSGATEQVTFHIVGDGLHRGSLQKRAEARGVTDCVLFHGAHSGDSLEHLFQGCQLAVGNLGVHRKGMVTNPDLKNREYCSRGLPFITSTIDPGFPEDFPYLLQISADETPLDVTALVSFVKKLQREDGHREAIRRYAEQHFDWSVMLQPVAEKIKSCEQVKSDMVQDVEVTISRFRFRFSSTLTSIST